ncbi:MAG: ABC transporter substrate-binding protein [Thermomicrobiales bacterium]
MDRDLGRRHQISRRDVLRYGAGVTGGALLGPAAWRAAAFAQDGPVTVPDFTSSIEPQPVSLDLWTFVDTHARWFELMAEGYAAQVNPDFQLNVVQTAYEEHHNKLLVSFQAQGAGAPDLADIEQGRFGAFMKGEIGLVDQTEMLTSEGYLEQLVAARQSLYGVGETIYGVEHALCPVVLYYRNDLYGEMEQPLATWDDFIAATKALASDTTTGVSISWALFDIVLRQRGFDVFDQDGNVTADSPEAVETLEWVFSLRDEHGIGAEPPAGAQASGTAADQSFYAAVREGQFVAIPGADWYAGFLKDNVADLAGNWRAQYLPAWEAGGARTSVNGGTGLTIVKWSENQEAAWDFIRYAMLTAEGNVQRYLAINLWPPFQAAWEDERLLSPDDYFGGQVLGELFGEVGAEAPAQYQSPFRADFNLLRQNKYTRPLFDGDMTPADGLKQLADEIRELQG